MNSSNNTVFRGLCEDRWPAIARLSFHLIDQKFILTKSWSFELVHLQFLMTLSVTNNFHLLERRIHLLEWFLVPLKIIAETAKILLKIDILNSQKSIIIEITFIYVCWLTVLLILFGNIDLLDLETFLIELVFLELGFRNGRNEFEIQ